MNKKLIKKITYWVLIAFFSLTFIFSGYFLIDYFVNSKQQENLYNDLAGIVDANRPTEGASTPSTGEAPDSTDPTEGSTAPTEDPVLAAILPEYRAIWEMNNDLVGWIKIPDTNINYPVVQSKEKDYYLYRNFSGEESIHGTIYAREECDVLRPSDNVTVFGHHMKDGSMFNNLDFYMRKSFWKDHQTITFDTIHEHRTYQVFAVFKTSGDAGVGYPFHVFVDAMSEDHFNQFVADIKGMSLYDTGITAEYGDKLLCLCTCEYSKWNYRLIVVAKLITEE